MKAREDLKIFVVDDDTFCRKMYSTQLKKLGYGNIIEFSNGQDCINDIIQ